MGTLSQKKPSSRLYEFPPTTKRIFVIGDLHGDRSSYDTAVNSWRKEKGSNILFLGDYADRGTQGLEIIESLMKLSKEDFIIRSHEPNKAREGPQFQHNRRIMTISSTNAYERPRRPNEHPYRPHYQGKSSSYLKMFNFITKN